MVELVLRTRLEVIYAGTDISAEISDDLIAFTYTDNEHGKADDLEISLRNNHGRWTGEWMPARGDTLTCRIIQEGRGALPALNCGVFTIDEIGASGPPSTFTIRAVSVPPDSSARRQVKSRAWENVKLSEIAQDVAGSAGVALLWLASSNPLLDRRDQRDESDLKFLQRLCEDEALALKCTDAQLVVFSPEEMAGKPAVFTIDVGSDDVIDWGFGAQSHDTFAKCILEYLDAASGKLCSYTYKDPQIKDGKTHKVNKRAPSLAEAERLARAALFKANQGEQTGSINLVGDTRAAAGAVVYVNGVGRYSGRYYIQTARHSVSNGYKTSLELSSTREQEGKKSVRGVKKTKDKTKERRPDGLESILGE